MKINLRNSSAYCTADVRALLRRCIDFAGVDRPDVVWRIGVHPASHGRCDGRALISSTTFWIYLPRVEATDGKAPSFLIRTAAQVIAHELDHCRGLQHHDMVDWWTLPSDHVDDLQLRLHVQPRRTSKNPSRARAGAAPRASPEGG